MTDVPHLRLVVDNGPLDDYDPSQDSGRWTPKLIRAQWIVADSWSPGDYAFAISEREAVKECKRRNAPPKDWDHSFDHLDDEP
jgi:hypothetical protein